MHSRFNTTNKEPIGLPVSKKYKKIVKRKIKDFLKSFGERLPNYKKVYYILFYLTSFPEFLRMENTSEEERIEFFRQVFQLREKFPSKRFQITYTSNCFTNTTVTKTGKRRYKTINLQAYHMKITLDTPNDYSSYKEMHETYISGMRYHNTNEWKGSFICPISANKGMFVGFHLGSMEDVFLLTNNPYCLKNFQVYANSFRNFKKLPKQMVELFKNIEGGKNENRCA